MKKCLIILLLALPPMSYAASAVTHVRYNQTITIVPTAIESMKASCDHARQINVMLAEIGQPPLANYKEDKLFGDAGLIGQGIKDEYWSHDGTYHAQYEMSYSTTNSGLPMCQLRVVPSIKVTYKNYRTLTKHVFSREYLDSTHLTDMWSDLERFKQGHFKRIAGEAVKSEHWSISKLPDPARAKELAPLLQDMFIGDVQETDKETTKDMVLGRICKTHTLTRYAAAGMGNSNCGWDNAGGVPETIIAKGHLNIGGGGSISSIAKSLNLNEATPLNTLRPPAKWRNKPVDSYLKSKKTKNQWMNWKQQQVMDAARVRKEKTRSQEEKKARRRIKIETGKMPED